MNIHIDDTARSSRRVVVIQSTTAWPDFHQKMAEAFNIFPDSLQVQYRLSTDARSALFIDLASQIDLDHLIQNLRPLVVPALLANGQRSKRPKRPVAVEIRNKGADTATGGKGKVCTSSEYLTISLNVIQKTGGSSKTSSTSHTGDGDVTKSKAELDHEKRLSFRKKLTTRWTCSIHSLPDKPVLCYQDMQQRCFPITEQHINMWAMLAVSLTGLQFSTKLIIYTG